MAVTVSLGKTYAKSICSIFPLCMESNAWEKSTNKCVASKVLYEHLKFDGLLEFVNRFLQKPF